MPCPGMHTHAFITTQDRLARPIHFCDSQLDINVDVYDLGGERVHLTDSFKTIPVSTITR